MQKRLSLSLTLLTLLAGCGLATPSVLPSGQPSPGPSASPALVVFSGAQSKRNLNLANLGSLAGTGTSSASDSTKAPVASSPASSVAPGAPLPARDVAGGRAGISLPYPYYGGGEFNNYVPVMAEENIFAGNGSGEILGIYRESVLPLLQQWDAQARLIESRGDTQPGLKDPNSYEYVYVPGVTVDQPMQIRPDWVFRFASSTRKETLNVYVTAKETRVYRVVWSEPDIAIARVNLPVSKAVSIARGAIANRSSEPGYPVYPDASAQLGNNATTVYDLPAQLNWSVTLGQQGDQLVYYLSANYAEAFGQPGVVVVPSPYPGGSTPAVGIAKDTVVSPQPAAPPVQPMPEASPSPKPSPEPTAMPTTLPTAMPTPVCVLPSYVYLYAAVNIDAVSGKILSVNRPVRYSYDQSVYCRAYPPATAMPAPETVKP